MGSIFAALYGHGGGGKGKREVDGRDYGWVARDGGQGVHVLGGQ